MPLSEVRNSKRKINNNYYGKDGLFKRIYTKEEVKDDGVVIHASVNDGELVVHEFLVEQVGNKAIKFKEKGILGKQIPLTSIGFVSPPKIKGLVISIEGTALSRDFNQLVNTILAELSEFINEQKSILSKQYKVAEKSFLHWQLDCEVSEEQKKDEEVHA
ncbi:hypothetical protein [Neobacillus sp. LXY-1]|uniref:hypothetical protein n=1 Tax=Neobacillus sp. LXY-1 TaxID=3379133 RepID=UPI003EE07880